MGITFDTIAGQSDTGNANGTGESETLAYFPGTGIGTDPGTGRRRRNRNSSREATPPEAQNPTGSAPGQNDAQAQETVGDTFQVGEQGGRGSRASSTSPRSSGGKSHRAKASMSKAQILKSAGDDADQIITLVNMTVGSALDPEAMITEDDREYQMIKPSLAQIIAETPGYDKIADKKGPLVLLAGSVMWAFKAYMVYLVKNNKQPFWVTMRVPREKRKPHVSPPGETGQAEWTPDVPTKARVRYEPVAPEQYIEPEFVPYDTRPDEDRHGASLGLNGMGAPVDMGFGSPIGG